MVFLSFLAIASMSHFAYIACMSYWEIVGVVATGAGTLASILGVFFAVYARHNGRMTRDFIAAQNRDMREFIAAQSRDIRDEMREFIAAQNRDMREFLAKVLERLAGRISEEGEKTREEIGKLRRSTG